jgi:HK97 gp10 family phage protein
VSVKVTVTGQTEVRAALAKLSRSVHAQAKQVVAATCLHVETGAKMRCPVRTGRLRSSIHSDIASDGLSGTVGTNVVYARPVEFGSRGRAPKPFLIPAFEAERLKFVAALRAALKEAVA